MWCRKYGKYSLGCIQNYVLIDVIRTHTAVYRNKRIVSLFWHTLILKTKKLSGSTFGKKAKTINLLLSISFIQIAENVSHNHGGVGFWKQAKITRKNIFLFRRVKFSVIFFSENIRGTVYRRLFFGKLSHSAS